MTGRAIINIETFLTVGVILAALVRCPSSKAAPAETAPSRWVMDVWDALAMASLLALTAAAYWRAAHLYFVSDDFVLLKMARLFSGNYGAIFSHGGGDGFFRPLGYISIDWTWAWAGLDALRWHLVPLALHCLNTVVLYVLARTIGLARAWATFAAALFSVHGAHPEAVTWIAGRFDVQASAFVLAGMVAFLRYWEDGRFAWGAGAALAMTGGILSKESAYALPLMMTAYAATRADFRKKSLTRLTPFFLVAIVLFAYRWVLQGGIGGYLTAQGPNQGSPQMISLHPLSLANALLARVWPVLFFPVNWTHRGAGIAIAAIAAAVACVALAWKPRGPRSKLLAPIGLTLAAAIPAAGLLLIGADLEKARLLYLPSAGFCLLAASLAEMAAPKTGIVAAITLSAFQLFALGHNLNIWQSVATKAKAVCEAAVSCSNPESVTALPRSLDGVYFFANGFPECVRIEQSKLGAGRLQKCSLTWDPRTEQLRQMK